MHERIAKIIQEAGVTYKLRLHKDLGIIKSPNDVANAIGYDLARIAKTLLLRAVGEERFFLVLVPTNAKVDLKRLADIVGARRLQMATKDELDNQLDYPSHGVSPIGASGMQVLMNASLLTHETILIGAGIVGEEIELQPQAVQELANATVVELVQTVQTLG